MQAFEESLRDHSDDQNESIYSYATARLVDLETSILSSTNKIILHGESNSFTTSADCGQVISFTANVNDAMADAAKWLVDVALIDDMAGSNAKRRGDLGFEWYAEIVEQDGQKKLHVAASIESCESHTQVDQDGDPVVDVDGNPVPQTYNYVVNAVWCGEQPDVDDGRLGASDPSLDGSLGDPLNVRSTGADSDAHGEGAKRKIVTS